MSSYLSSLHRCVLFSVLPSQLHVRYARKNKSFHKYYFLSNYL